MILIRSLEFHFGPRSSTGVIDIDFTLAIFSFFFVLIRARACHHIVLEFWAAYLVCYGCLCRVRLHSV